MRNKIELLRAIYFDEDDYKNISEFNHSFTEKEREFMFEFKKIYELGLNQLEKFIKKLKDEGKELEPWDIIYYVTQLLNGILSSHAKALADELECPYFEELPNNLGSLGNRNQTKSNATVSLGYQHQLGAMVDTFNNLPDFIQKTIGESVLDTEDLFRGSLFAATRNDNTLPLIDKKPQERYTKEPKGEWVLLANANYIIKDSFYYKVMENVRDKIFEKVKEFLGDEDYRIFEDNKSYKTFDSEDNNSKAEQFIIKKIVKEGDKEEILETDLFGSIFDSIEKRKFEMVVSKPESDKKYLTNTNIGQLGNED
jgi:hypothetical protein